MHRRSIAFPLLILLSGCSASEEAMSADEARLAIDEAALSTQASDLSFASIDISTNFTIGRALENAAAQLSKFILTQMPCATVTLCGSRLVIVYNAKPKAACAFQGHKVYRGTQIVSISRNESDSVVVDHEWIGLSNGWVTVDGTARVTWDFGAKSRHVTHSLQWRRAKDGLSGTGKGDRTQRALHDNIATGFEVNGDLSWSGPRGNWSLEIDNAQMRYADPVPQAGTYTIINPDNKQSTLSFKRLDNETIEVTLMSGERIFIFRIGRTGVLTPLEDDK